MDIETIKHYDSLLAQTERYLIEQARIDNPQLFSLLKTWHWRDPGSGYPL